VCANATTGRRPTGCASGGIFAKHNDTCRLCAQLYNNNIDNETRVRARASSAIQLYSFAEILEEKSEFLFAGLKITSLSQTNNAIP